MKTITVDGIEYVEKGTELPVMDAVTAPYIIGANYLIRTVTHTYTGKLVWVGEKELVLDTCAWIADSGRWMSAVSNGTLDEIEPMGDGKVIGRGAIVDASVVTWELPTSQK
jgi:hypothetical protein